jgi:hypothetical protein
MPVGAGIIIAWPGTAASIPSGWDRVTDLDDRYIKGTADGVNPDVTGGAATHTHTAPSHTHSIASHAHTAPSSSGSSSGGTVVSGTEGDGVVASTHTHAGQASGDASSSTSSGTTPTFATAINDPAFLDAIYIESDGTPVAIPDGGVAWFNNSTPPSSWIQNVASKDRFLIGAAAAGDGGATGGGSHVHAGISHTHGTNHVHANAYPASTSSTPIQGTTGGGTTAAANSHQHQVTYNVGNTPSGLGGNTASTTHQPPFHTLLAIENDKGSDDLPTNLIAMWLSLLASIPIDWVLCDGTNSTPDLRSKFVKAANLTSEVGDTGGTDGHDHTDPSAHTHSAHQHSVASETDGVGRYAGSGGATAAVKAHSHTWNSSGGGGTTGGTVQTVNSTADTQPPFRTVAYIMNTAIPSSPTSAIAIATALGTHFAVIDALPIFLGASYAPSIALAAAYEPEIELAASSA